MSRRFFRVPAIVAAFLASTIALPFLLRTQPGSQSWAIPIAQAYALPTTALVILLLFRQLATHDPSQAKQGWGGGSDALILNAGIAFVVGLHLVLLARLLGGAEWVARAPSLLVGVFLILVGNVLPRLRRSLLVGVRTPWSLSDARAWTRTHWASGYALFAFGLIVLAVALLAPAWVGRVVSLGAFLLAAALVLASYGIGLRCPGLLRLRSETRRPRVLGRRRELTASRSLVRDDARGSRLRITGTARARWFPRLDPRVAPPAPGG